MLSFPDLPERLAVVAHDAGAANLILPWLGAVPGAGVRAFVQGPALTLWCARFGERGLVATLGEALEGAELVLTGTGWASALEHEARVIARRRGQRCAAVIDHWVNYPERFERGGQTQWPDEFWLTDTEAVTIASRHFPVQQLRCHANGYLAEQQRSIAPLSAQQHVLYVMEPMRTDWGRGVAGEWQALDGFMQHRVAAGIPPSAPMRLRPHPSDDTGKYGHWLARHPQVQLDDSPTLAGAISRARWVVGCESMVLVVALAAGRDVISSLPPWAPPCRLPHAGIRRLQAARPLQAAF
jgi:hypothetical protein